MMAAGYGRSIGGGSVGLRSAHVQAASIGSGLDQVRASTMSPGDDRERLRRMGESVAARREAARFAAAGLDWSGHDIESTSARQNPKVNPKLCHDMCQPLAQGAWYECVKRTHQIGTCNALAVGVYAACFAGCVSAG